MKKNNKKGFTLIELLVVIAIIAVLSTVVMAGLNSARAKGRDAKRLSEVKAIQSALELYYDSCSGYPTSINLTAPGTATYGDTPVDGSCSANTLKTKFLPNVPVNPFPGGMQYIYTVDNTNGTRAGYMIEFMLEQPAANLPVLATGEHFMATEKGVAKYVTPPKDTVTVTVAGTAGVYTGANRRRVVLTITDVSPTNVSCALTFTPLSSGNTGWSGTQTATYTYNLTNVGNAGTYTATCTSGGANMTGSPYSVAVAS